MGYEHVLFYSLFFLIFLSFFFPCSCTDGYWFLQVVVSTLGLLFMGKLLEPIWGSKEFLKFIFVINVLTSVCVFSTAIALYYITRQENYLWVLWSPMCLRSIYFLLLLLMPFPLLLVLFPPFFSIKYLRSKENKFIKLKHSFPLFFSD